MSMEERSIAHSVDYNMQMDKLAAAIDSA